MPGGFASPSILFLNSWNRVERDYMQRAVTRLHATGKFELFAEPCAGAFVMSSVARQAGFFRLEASDVNPFSAIVGNALAGRDLRELDFALDGNAVELTGEPISDAAILLYLQLLVRMEAKPPIVYWQEMIVDLKTRAKEHCDKLEYYLEQLHQRLPGLAYRSEDPWETMRRLSGDEDVLMAINPPSYPGAYERFYDTKGRMTWDSPEYEVWTAERDLPALVEESAGWDATLLCLQMAPHGECPHPDPVYAHDKRRGANDYIWSNHPDVVRAALGGDASRTRTSAGHEKLDNPIIPVDYEVKADSEVGFQKVTAKVSRYYKDLWIHRIDASQAAAEIVVFVDGFVVGMAGFSSIPLADEEQSLSMLYCVGAPHDTLRLGRLVKTLVLSRCVIESTMNPWFVTTAKRVLTKNWTKHPEAKGQRGLMKLLDRKPHAQYGFELLYGAPIADRSVQEAFDLWFKKETAWQQTRKVAA